MPGSLLPGGAPGGQEKDRTGEGAALSCHQPSDQRRDKVADTIRKVGYYSMNVADKPGEGARVLQVLSEAGVNLLAFSGFPRGRRAQLDFVPEEAGPFRRAMTRAKLKLQPRKTVFLVQAEDRGGAVAELVHRLAEAKINVTAVDAVTTGEGRYGALIWVKPADVNKAAKALKAV